MSDLIERLRKQASNSGSYTPLHMVSEAADEIERLTAELGDFTDLHFCDCCEGLFDTVIGSDHYQCDTCTELAIAEESINIDASESVLREKEIERLTAELEVKAHQHKRDLAEYNRVAKRIAKLDAALKEIVRNDGDEWAVDLAKEALQEGCDG